MRTGFLTGLLLILSVAKAQDSQKPIILNIRGGDGTGGFTFGGDNAELSSFSDFTNTAKNRGWGEFAQTLQAEGYVTQELREGNHIKGCEVHETNPCSTPVDFAGMDLSKYSVIIMGSNNSRYGKPAVDAIMKYIEEGGGIIFLSDANFGRNWRDAALSDQAFLDRFGLVMNQDLGYYPLKRSDGDFLIPNHPILEGVNEFNGEGVSPITFVKEVEKMKVEIVVRAKNKIRRNSRLDGTPLNNANNGQGPTSDAGNKDATLIVAEYGKGRAVFHYDRNTFFNSKAATSSLTQVDNKKFALNMMAWVGRKDASTSIRLPVSPARSSLNGGFEGDVFNLEGRRIRSVSRDETGMPWIPGFGQYVLPR